MTVITDVYDLGSLFYVDLDPMLAFCDAMHAKGWQYQVETGMWHKGNVRLSSRAMLSLFERLGRLPAWVW